MYVKLLNDLFLIKFIVHDEGSKFILFYVNYLFLVKYING